MLDFLKRQPVTALPEAVRSSLSQERNVSAAASFALKMVQERGLYSGRKVTYFRVFNPMSLATQPHGFGDVEGVGVLYAGHIEPEGHVVLSR